MARAPPNALGTVLGDQRGKGEIHMSGSLCEGATRSLCFEES